MITKKPPVKAAYFKQVCVLVRGRLSHLVQFCLFLLYRGRRSLRAAFLSFFKHVEIVAGGGCFAVRRRIAYVELFGVMWSLFGAVM